MEVSKFNNTYMARIDKITFKVIYGELSLINYKGETLPGECISGEEFLGHLPAKTNKLDDKTCIFINVIYNSFRKKTPRDVFFYYLDELILDGVEQENQEIKIRFHRRGMEKDEHFLFVYKDDNWHSYIQMHFSGNSKDQYLKLSDSDIIILYNTKELNNIIHNSNIGLDYFVSI